MQTHQLTEEQLQVIHHPIGMHARVLAVAGSGKSTTLAYRIKHLVLEWQVDPASIVVLMFNRYARQQFLLHLDRTGLSKELQPEVHTFHSFAYKSIRRMMENGLLPGRMQFWTGDKAELAWLTVLRAIRNLEWEGKLLPGLVDPEAASTAISLWKGALLPPERAWSETNPCLPLVYAEYERLRREKAALTFDDFIPLAVDYLENHPKTCLHYWHVIADEYQDVNFGQQRLIELLAGNHANVMVVGDDDQTIYEWRGARPNYILTDFESTFTGKQVRDYCLSRSFRFGPLIAHCAASLIGCNSVRRSKPLVSHNPDQFGFLQVFREWTDANHELAEQVLSLIRMDGTLPNEVVVLGRLYAQMDGLEAEFLAREIPYRVDGKEPFFRRSEIAALLDYLRLAAAFDEPMTHETAGWLLNIANKPFRMLSAEVVSKLTNLARRLGFSTRQVLEETVLREILELNIHRRAGLSQIREVLDKVSRLQYVLTAGELLDKLAEELDYLASFRDYYGRGEHAEEKIRSVQNFLQYAAYTRLSLQGLLDHLEGLDTTRGVPPEEQILFTTIFRTKGLEFDYVILPDCNENALPYLKGEPNSIYDRQGKYRQIPLSSKLESERRLMYVAITRAKVGVLIGTSGNPSRFIQELNLQEGERITQ